MVPTGVTSLTVLLRLGKLPSELMYNLIAHRLFEYQRAKKATIRYNNSRLFKKLGFRI